MSLGLTIYLLIGIFVLVFYGTEFVGFSPFISGVYTIGLWPLVILSIFS